MDTGREVVVWEDPLIKRAAELSHTFPYGHHALSLKTMTLHILWVLEQEKKQRDTLS
jgi:hypothetical protein